MSRQSAIARFACAATSLFLIAARPARAGSYHDASNGFTVDAPPGWTEISPATLTRFVATATKPGVTPPNYVTGFTSAKDGSMTFPYILVQAMPQRVSFREVQSQMSNVTQSSLKLSDTLRPDLVNTLSLSAEPKTTANPADHTFTMNMQIAVTGGTPIHCATFGFVGKDGVINVHCYDDVNRFTAAAPAFQATVASFHFDPGQEYTPSVNEPGLSFVSNSAVVGGVVGAAIVVVVAVARRKANG